MWSITHVLQAKQQVAEMRRRLQDLHDNPSSGEDTRRSTMRHIEQCDVILRVMEVRELMHTNESDATVAQGYGASLPGRNSRVRFPPVAP